MTMKFCAAAIVLSSLVSAADVTPVVIEEIIAKVNGDIITRGEMERERRLIEQEMRAQGLTGPRLQEAITNTAKRILRDRIDQLLLLSKAKEMNLNVDADVNKQLAAIQKKLGIADPDKFQQAVREQTGQSFEEYKSDMKNSLLTQKVVRQEVSSTIQFKREELTKYYDEHKDEFQRKERVFLREMLVSTEGKDAAGLAAAEKKAKDLSTRASKGERFPELAQANSDAPTAPIGGDIGSYEKGQLVKDLEDAIWDKPRGFVTPPIKTAKGFLILRVDEHQKEGLASFDEVELEVQDKLFGPRMEPKMREYLTKLRQEAFLEIKAGYEDQGAAPGKNTAWADPLQLRPETISKQDVAAQLHRKKVLWMVPIPGTSTQKTGTSSSR
jgi:peptidyl-prolyl cis-trans isomerase SurA